MYLKVDQTYKTQDRLIETVMGKKPAKSRPSLDKEYYITWSTKTFYKIGDRYNSYS